ncbi:DUF1533 domain-containing protein [Clostridiaceae bacterium M8S5]|nr:DUF1533 domain-containing protein [Clostridiaceae bacterium M8S5]
MKKKIISIFLGLLLVNFTIAFAITEQENLQIDGNALLIGEHLFELGENAEILTLEKFIDAARSIIKEKSNKIYYKDKLGNWYELLADENMNTKITISEIENKIKKKNGKSISGDPNRLTAKDLIISPTEIVENQSKQGTFDTIVKVSIKRNSNAKFASFNGGPVDTITGASLVGSQPTGTNVNVERIDDKNIQFKITGTATSHDSSINTTSNRTEKNRQDYNNNGLYGDIKFLMLENLFTGVSVVENGGQYAVVDVKYNDVQSSGKIIDEVKSRITNIEQVHYGVLAITTGSIYDYDFTLNDVALNPTKVNDQGTIVKFEINPNEVASVKVTNKTDNNLSDTIKLGSGEKDFTGVIENEDPDRILVSGPVSYSDYYLVDYDENGKVRSELEKTTFNTENEGSKPVDTSVPALTLEKERTLLGNDIVIKFDNTSINAKKWQANIYEVLKDYGKSETTRVPVEFRVEDGKIIILAKSTAIDDRNGMHTVVIKSNGFNDVKVTFELIERAGELLLNSNFNWWAHNDLLFELTDFNYAIINPVHTVLLDDQKLEGDCKEWHVVSNLIRLENDALSKLTVGKHTIVVKATGFEDYKKTFELVKAPAGSENPKYDGKALKSNQFHGKVDAVTSASINGSSGTGGGSIRANVIYDFDHLANAKILTELDMATPYVKATLNWWGLFKKDAILTNESDKVVDYIYYKNKVGYEDNGNYVTFKDYFDSLPGMPTLSQIVDINYDVPKGLYVNKPYYVKNMLHDGVLGDMYQYSQATAKETPTLSSKKVMYGNDIVITYGENNGADDWADKIINIKINSNYLRYSIDKNKNTITFKASDNSFVTGKNIFVFTSEGYKTTSISINMSKETPKNIKAKQDDANNIIVKGFTSDYIASLTSVYLDAKGLFNDSQVGGNSGAYEVVGDTIVLRSKLFGSDSGQYANDKQHVLKIKANGYNDYTFSFTPNNLKGNLKKVPNYVELDDEKNTYKTGSDVEITISETMDKNYSDAITEVMVNEQKVEYSKSFNNIVLKGNLFTKERSYKIVIKATNYKNKKFNVKISNDALKVPSYVTFAQDGKKVPMGTELKVLINDGIFNSVYGNAITKVTIGNIDYKPIDVGINSNSNKFFITDKVSLGSNHITIKSTGYKDKTFSITITEEENPAKLVKGDKLIDEKMLNLLGANDVKITLGGYTSQTYMNSITAVKLDDIELVKDSDYKFSKEGYGFYSYNVLTVDKSKFTNNKSYTLKIESNGYLTANFEINVKNVDESNKKNSVPKSVGIGNENLYDILKENSVTLKSSKDVIIVLGGTSDKLENNYINAITNVTIGGKDYSYSIDNKGIGWLMKKVIAVPASYFPLGETKKVIIRATDYEDKVFEITKEQNN